MNRVLSCPVPSNINPLSPNGFMFSIARLPDLTYFCQEVPLPDISITAPEIATPFVNYPVPGEKLNFGSLNVQFLVDSEMKNYKAIFNWLNGLGFPEDYEQFAEQARSPLNLRTQPATVSDATLTILNNSNLPIQTVQFVDCFPESLQSLNFTSTSQDVNYLVGNATFRYSHYRFV